MSITPCVRCSHPVDTDYSVECFDMIGKCLCDDCQSEARESEFATKSDAIFSDFFMRLNPSQALNEPHVTVRLMKWRVMDTLESVVGDRA